MKPLICPGLPTFSGDVDDTPSDFYERLPGISLFKVVTFPVNISRQKGKKSCHAGQHFEHDLFSRLTRMTPATPDPRETEPATPRMNAKKEVR